ncbi:hypothetical protein FRC14_007147, partial [Serendipita sp. 396]
MATAPPLAQKIEDSIRQTDVSLHSLSSNRIQDVYGDSMEHEHTATRTKDGNNDSLLGKKHQETGIGQNEGTRRTMTSDSDSSPSSASSSHRPTSGKISSHEPMTPHEERSTSAEPSSSKGVVRGRSPSIPHDDTEGRKRVGDRRVVDLTKNNKAPNISFTSIPSSLPDDPVDLLLQLNVELLRVYNEFQNRNLAQSMASEMQQYSNRIQSNMQWILQHTPSLGAQPPPTQRIPHPIIVPPPSAGLPPSTVETLYALYAQVSVVFKEHIEREQKRIQRRSHPPISQGHPSHSPMHSRSSSLNQEVLNENNKRARTEDPDFGDGGGDRLLANGQREESPKRKRLDKRSGSASGVVHQSSASPTSNSMEVTWHTLTPPSDWGSQVHRPSGPSGGEGGEGRSGTPLRIPTPVLRPGSAQSNRSPSPMLATNGGPHHHNPRGSMGPPPLPIGPSRMMSTSPTHNPSPTYNQHQLQQQHPDIHVTAFNHGSPHSQPNPQTPQIFSPQATPSSLNGPSPLPSIRPTTDAANPLMKLSAAEIQARYLEFRNKLTPEQRARIDSSQRSQSDLDLWNSLGNESESTTVAVTTTPTSNASPARATGVSPDVSPEDGNGLENDAPTTHTDGSATAGDSAGSVTGSETTLRDNSRSQTPSADSVSNPSTTAPTASNTTQSAPSSAPLPPLVIPQQHLSALYTMVISPNPHPSVQMLRDRVQNFDRLTPEKKVQLLWAFQQNKIRVFKAEQEKMREERARLGLGNPFAAYRRNGEGNGVENPNLPSGNILIRGMPMFPNARDGIFNFGTGVIGPAPFPYSGQNYAYPHARTPSNPTMAPPPLPPYTATASTASSAPSPAPSSSGSVTVVGNSPPPSRKGSVSASTSPQSAVSQLSQSSEGAQGGIDPAMMMMGHNNHIGTNAVDGGGYPQTQPGAGTGVFNPMNGFNPQFSMMPIGAPSAGMTPTPQQLLMQINNPSASSSSSGYQRHSSPALSTTSSSATLVGSPYNPLAMFNHPPPPYHMVGMGGTMGPGDRMQNGGWSPSARTLVQGPPTPQDYQHPSPV